MYMLLAIKINFLMKWFPSLDQSGAIDNNKCFTFYN